MSDPLARLSSFLAELKRRKVYRVGAVYVAVAFLLLEGVDLLVDPLGLPPVVMTVLVVMALFGFPLALVLAWALEATPEGVRRTEPRTAPSAGPEARGRGGAWVLLAFGVLGAGAAGWWLLAGAGDDRIDVSGIRSIAILPLDNLSGDPEQEPFVAGMHEELINQLSRVGVLLVKSRTSVMRYGSDDITSIPEIGRALGVDAVLEGSVLRADDDRVRITVQLIHVPTDTHLWSRAFDRELRDVLALHSEVARAVADEVQAVLTPEERRRLTRTREVDPDALDHYVRGRYLWNQRTEEALRDALSEFQAALDIDPSYAEAWAGIADVYAVPAGAGLAENPTARAIEAARRALALDSTLAEAHTALAYGLVGEWAWEESERHFRRAIELNPSYATAHQWYAELLTAQNRMDEAVASARRATVRDPLSGIISWNLARTLYFARRYPEALDQLGRGERGTDLRTRIHLQMDQPDSAWAAFLRDVELPPTHLDYLQSLRDAGWTPFAALNQLIRDVGPPSGETGEAPPPAVLEALAREAAVVEGRHEEALDRLVRIAEPGALGGFIVDLVADPIYDPIRDEPRYRAFLREAGLARYWPESPDRPDSG